MKKLAEAIAIVKDISSDKFTNEEKAKAIYLVMNMATHNFVTKADFLSVIKWLWHNFYEYAEGEKQTQFDRIKLMSIDEMAEAFGKDNYCQVCMLTEGQTCDNTPCKQGIMQYLESEVEEE